MRREGRCALVTSFQAFKYMAAYSLIQFTAEMILYNINSMLGDYQFIFVDFMVISPLALFSMFMRVRAGSVIISPRPLEH